MSLGVDIYRYQTVTDFQAMGSAVAYAWVKLTDGDGPAVVRGDKQVNGCRAAGIPVGGYHYAQRGDPVKQASVFLAECQRLGALDLAPALDMEAPFAPNATARDFATRFCTAVAQAGHRPAVYMSASWAGTLRPDQWGIPGLVVWVAAYGVNDGKRYPSSVTRYYEGPYHVHQFTSTGHVPGVSGNVDLNWALADIRNRTADLPEEDEDVRNLILAEAAELEPGETVPRTWVGNGMTRRHVADEKELEGLRHWIGQAGGDPTVHRGWEDLRVLGVAAGESASGTLPSADLDKLADLVAARLGTLRFEAGTD